MQEELKKKDEAMANAEEKIDRPEKQVNIIKSLCCLK